MTGRHIPGLLSDVVSRETDPQPAAVAAAVFGPGLARALRYVDIMATAGGSRRLLGPREVSRLWKRHLLNWAVGAEAAPPGARVADIGSCAGLPGLCWALARPDLTVVLVEPLLRRATFLEEVVADLGMSSVSVLRSRAEDIAGTDAEFDVVTARAVAPLDRLLPWCAPLTRRGGTVVALKGQAVDAELAAARPGLPALGLSEPVVRTYGAGVLDRPTTVVELRRLEDPATEGGRRKLAR